MINVDSLHRISQSFQNVLDKTSSAYTVDDDFLINNFYEILAFEYDFGEVFGRIGIEPKLNLNFNEVKKIKEWLNRNDNKSNPKIELIKRFEEFRAKSRDPKNFESQIESVVNLYELIINVFDFTKEYVEYDLKFLDYKDNLNYLKNSQNFAFQLENFKRDNLVHPLRVFLLGCYIINTDKKFWRQRLWESVQKDIPHSGTLAGRILYKLDLSESKTNVFLMKSVFLVWMISSLFHDIGRSIQDAKKTIEEVTETYGNLPKFDWGYNEISRNITISELKLSCLIIEPNEIGTKKKDALFKFLDWITKEKQKQKYIEKIMNKKYEEKDHGVISAILSTDESYLEYHRKNTSKDLYENPFRSFFYLLIHYSFVSICMHNDQKYFFISPLTQLLIAVDTLQEWDRTTKIGDIERKIYPCDKIELTFSELNGSKNIKVIEAIIPYTEPKDIFGKDIFSRREIDHENDINKFIESQEEKEFYDFFIEGVELRIGYLEDKNKNIFKWKICGFCGKITKKNDPVPSRLSLVIQKILFKMAIKDKIPYKDMNVLFCINSKCESYERK